VYSAPVNLLLYYIGFGYVLFLVWAMILSDAVKSEPPPWTHTATTVLQIVGIAHPAAALGAWDLRRELSRNRGDIQTPRGGVPVTVIVSVVIAAAVIVLTTRS